MCCCVHTITKNIKYKRNKITLVESNTKKCFNLENQMMKILKHWNLASGKVLYLAKKLISTKQM